MFRITVFYYVKLVMNKFEKQLCLKERIQLGLATFEQRYLLLG